MLHMLGHAVFGLVIGLLARAVLPGTQRMGLILTMILGACPRNAGLEAKPVPGA